MSIFARLFGKSEAAPFPETQEITFKRKVEAFWAWYASVSDQLLDLIETKASGNLPGIMSPQVEALYPGFAWEFGPPPDGKTGHSFTLSGEGVLAKQLLAIHAVSKAPNLPGWSFHASRQPTKDPGQYTLRIEDQEFKPLEFWITPEIDEHHEVIDLTVWHPLFDKIPESRRGFALFLTLDEILGEFNTGKWVGEIKFSNQRLSESMPITELREFVDTTISSHSWKGHDPGEVWGSYQLREHLGGARGDTIAGTTMCWSLLRTYFKAPDTFEDPFENSHAEWVYVTIDAAFLPKGREVETRGQISDAIEQALSDSGGGQFIGGAIGREKAYVDLLIYDGERSIETIKAATKQFNLPPTARIEYMAANKRSQSREL